ncbi:hypothetical protein [Psychrobacter sp. JB385]|uniref:hypothetical protein n=1 Tax=Psychrobacter sp. JB385 TaxID=1434841 RepID=UPI000B3585BB|nr:hypothetical protein [Psychrobacter sp. JB385]
MINKLKKWRKKLTFRRIALELLCGLVDELFIYLLPLALIAIGCIVFVLIGIWISIWIMLPIVIALGAAAYWVFKRYKRI